MKMLLAVVMSFVVVGSVFAEDTCAEGKKADGTVCEVKSGNPKASEKTSSECPSVVSEGSAATHGNSGTSTDAVTEGKKGTNK
jgi:hypothetical protein